MKYYTEDLITVLNKAKELKKSNNLSYIGTETILYSILLTPKCDTSKILNDFCVNKDNFVPHYRKTFRHLSVEEYTPNALASLHDANDIALSFNLNFISLEILLMAILRINDCFAVKILRAIGVDLTKLYTQLYSKIKNAVNTALENVSEDVKNETKPTTNNYSSEKQINNTISPKMSDSSSENNPLKGLGYNMVERSKQGKIDPIIGRDEEISRIIQTLSRKTKNNPLLIGEAGVGKTAIVEGLALKIENGTVPEALKDSVLFSLDLGSLIAGTRYRGDFEAKLKSAIDYALEKKNIIFFIDEIHNIVGAGGTDGTSLDIAEIFKPLISRGELKIIGATTLNEYTKHIEKDPALERRFQPIIVEEPSIESTIEILKGIRPSFEAHHKVRILDEAIISAVKLSQRYITDRFLPDKAIDLIDEASSKKRVEITTFNNNVIKLEEKIKTLHAELDYAYTKRDIEAVKSIEKLIESTNKKIEEEKIKAYNKRKSSEAITENDIKELIKTWTKIPITNLSLTDSNKLISIEDELVKRIIGQNNAVEVVSKAIRRSRTSLKDPNKPIGSFLFVGPTGVGKSELAKALAEVVFGSKNSLIRFDMSEYSDKTAVNKLIGSAPGYVGYEKEGLLTEKVRRQPYSVILFDEIEKAHTEIFDLLLQVLDDGRLTDSKGRLVSFKNSLIILTSNLGVTERENKVNIGFGSNNSDNFNAIKESVEKYFRPEFINRLDDIIVFNNLTKNDCYDIADITINEIVKRLKDNNISLNVENSAIDYIVETAYNTKYGARPIKRAISKHIEDLLSDAIILGNIKPNDKVSVFYSGENMEYKLK